MEGGGAGVPPLWFLQSHERVPLSARVDGAHALVRLPQERQDPRAACRGRRKSNGIRIYELA